MDKVLIFFTWLFLVPTMAFAQVEVTAKVDRNQVRPGEVFYLTITVNTGDSGGSVQDPRLPDLNHFEILHQASGSEMRSIFANGKFQTQRAMTYQYTLTALQPGNYTIAAAEVVIDGNVHRTKPIQIAVSESAPPSVGGGSGGSGGSGEDDGDMNDVDQIFQQLLRRQLGRQQQLGRRGGFGGTPVDLKDAFQIQVEVDKTSVYVGEQVTVSWYLVTRAQIADIDTLKYPAVEGFWREDIELATRLNFRPEIINGISYERALLASFALFPIKPGNAKIDEYTAKCTVYAMNQFGAAGQQVQTQSSQVVPIQVLPLPTEGKPTDFTGAVGEFRVTGKVDNTAAKVGSPVTFKVRFEGRGNAKMIELPKIAYPAGLQAYEPKSSTKFFPDGRSFKEYEIILVPRHTGEMKIPAISTSFFDPRTKKYYTERTSEITLMVAPGDGVQSVAGSALSADVALNEKAAAPMKPTLPGLLLQIESGDEFTQAQRLGTWAVVALFGFVILGWRYRVEFGRAKKREGLKQRLKMKFAGVDKKISIGDSRGAAIEMTNTIYYVLGELSDLGGASREMAVLLAKAPQSFRRDVAAPLQKLMEQIEVLGFAPDEVVRQIGKKGELKDIANQLRSLLYRSLEYEFEEKTEN